MRAADGRREIVVGIDPARDWHLPLAWASDEAHRRGLGLRLVVAVRPSHQNRQVNGTPRTTALHQAGSEALTAGTDWARERHPGAEVATDLIEGTSTSMRAWWDSRPIAGTGDLAT